MADGSLCVELCWRACHLLTWAYTRNQPRWCHGPQRQMSSVGTGIPLKMNRRFLGSPHSGNSSSNQMLSYVVVAKPASDLCSSCQDNNCLIVRNVSTLKITLNLNVLVLFTPQPSLRLEGYCHHARRMGGRPFAFRALTQRCLHQTSPIFVGLGSYRSLLIFVSIL